MNCELRIVNFSYLCRVTSKKCNMSLNAMRIWLLVAIIGLLSVLMLTVDMYISDEPIENTTLGIMLTADLALLVNVWNLLKLWRKARRHERAKRANVKR